MTYTISTTRRQWLIKTSDGQRWLFQRSDKGAASLDRRLAKLQAAGYTEQAEQPHWLTAMVREIVEQEAAE